VRGGQETSTLLISQKNLDKLTKQAYEDGHRVIWNEDRRLEIESNSKYRKYKELAHMACLTNPISQPSCQLKKSL
jgi:hypothetical protein